MLHKAQHIVDAVVLFDAVLHLERLRDTTLSRSEHEQLCSIIKAIVEAKPFPGPQVGRTDKARPKTEDPALNSEYAHGFKIGSKVRLKDAVGSTACLVAEQGRYPDTDWINIVWMEKILLSPGNQQDGYYPAGTFEPAE